MEAIVVGGGIGGLAAAIALRAAGVEARVFEKAERFAEVGAGLSLWPNGLRALDRLGLGGAVRPRAVRDVDAALRSWDGRVLAAADDRALERLLGGVPVIVHRAEFLDLLREALPSTALETDAACTGVAERGDRAIATFAGGAEAAADFVVGADGLRSVVRARLFGDAPPRYPGYTAWRAIVPYDHEVLAPGISIGRGAQFGRAPMSGGRVYWFAAANGPAGRGGDGAFWRAHLLERFRDWHAPIPALIAATPAESVLHHDLFDRDPLPEWGAGRITLLGDAAHPMTPNLGQGANQALADAVALGTAVAGAAPAGVAAALRAYESARRPRANALILASRQVGKVVQLEAGPGAWLRDRLLGTPLARRRQLDQLRKVAAADA